MYMSLECQSCEDNVCCIYLGQRICPEHCRRQNCFCVRCQLSNIEEKSPAVRCQNCNFLSKCYGCKHLGSINGRGSYILQRHCIDHRVTPNCPHKDVVSVELNRVIQAPDYSRLIDNGDPQEAVNVQLQGTCTQRLEDRETVIPSIQCYPRIVPRLPQKDRIRPKGLLATEKSRRNQRSGQQITGSRKVQSELRLSSRRIVGTRSVSHTRYRGMQ